MKYRVIEFGFWRHDTFEPGQEMFVNFKETKMDLLKVMADWIVNNTISGVLKDTRHQWPEFFTAYTRESGITIFHVEEEWSVMFVPETHPDFNSPLPPRGAMDSWLHSDEIWVISNSYDFWDFYPVGLYSIEASLPSSSEWERLRPGYEYFRQKKIEHFKETFGAIAVE